MDEIQRIILQVENRDKLEQLNKELKTEEELLLKIIKANQQFPTTQSAAYLQTTAEKVRDLNGQIKDLEKTSGGLRSGGLMQLSYVLDDLTNTTGGWERKLASISNNIPGLVTGLGGSMGIAGAIGLIGTAAIALTPVVKAVIESFTGPDGFPGVNVVLDDAAERVKRLQSELDKILKARPFREKESAEAISFFLGDVGGEQVVSGTAAAIAGAGEGAQTTPEEKKRLKSLRETAEFTRNNWTLPGQREAAERDLQRVQTEIQERLNKENEKLAGELVAQVPTNPGARRRLERLAKQFPGGFPVKGFGEGLGELSPEALDAQDQAIKKEEEETREYRERKRARRKAVDEEIRDHEQIDAENLREFKTNRAKNRAGVDLDIRLNEEADRDNLREFEHAKAKKARAEAQEERDREHDENENLRNWNAAKRTRAVRQAKPQVIRQALQMGYGTPTGTQAEEMAREVVSLTKQGLATNDAIIAAVEHKAHEIAELRGRLMQQHARALQLQMGSEWSGNRSQFPPSW